jgi:hypothetical protein
MIWVDLISRANLPPGVLFVCHTNKKRQPFRRSTEKGRSPGAALAGQYFIGIK